MQNFDPSVMMAFDKEKIMNLDPSAMMGLAKEHISNFDPSVMMAFDKEKVMNLDPSAMMGLAKEHIMQMDQGALAGLNKDQADNLTIESKSGVANLVTTFKEFTLDVRKVIAEEPIRRLGGVGSFQDLAKMIASDASSEVLVEKGWDPQKMGVKAIEEVQASTVKSQMSNLMQLNGTKKLVGLFD